MLQELLRTGQLFVDQVRVSTRTPLVSIVLHVLLVQAKQLWPRRSRKHPSSPLSNSSLRTTWSVSPSLRKSRAISKVFADSYKSPMSVVVVDNIERLLGTSDCVANGGFFFVRPLTDV